jgi:hypothetical protein
MNKIKLNPRWSVVAACFILAGCLYTNIHAPHAYRSASPSDVKAAGTDPIVSGTACFRELIYLFAWGNAGYTKATSQALEGHPESILYDVKTDIEVNSYVFGLYARTCTIVTGRLGKP